MTSWWNRSERRILDPLREREHTVGELVELLGISQPGASKQLKVLRQAGPVSVRHDARRRRWHGPRVDPLTEIDEWPAPYRLYLGPTYGKE